VDFQQSRQQGVTNNLKIFRDVVHFESGWQNGVHRLVV